MIENFADQMIFYSTNREREGLRIIHIKRNYIYLLYHDKSLTVCYNRYITKYREII
jgi:hypothetical protein